MERDNCTPLTFQAPSSFFAPTFWEQLYDMKLNVHKLTETRKEINCTYNISDGVTSQSFEFKHCADNSTFDDLYPAYFQGLLFNVNTKEQFRDFDKLSFIQTEAESIWNSIISGHAISKPNLLLKLVVLSFADLKSYRFMYWMSAPAIIPSQQFLCTIPIQKLKVATSVSRFTGADFIKQFYESFYNHGKDTIEEMSPFFAIQVVEVAPFIVMRSLVEVWNERYESNTYFLFYDQSASNSSVGWVVRNLLMLFAQHHRPGIPNKEVNFIGIRNSRPDLMQRMIRNHSNSKDLPESFSITQLDDLIQNDCSIYFRIDFKGFVPSQSMGRVVGWECNDRGKPGPKVADLSSALNSLTLMSQSVDLNLRLMRWRAWPSLDTAKLSDTRCLLLGSGTLGCAVARTLVGWGIRNITFVDNGRVSYSNPTRQCLFEFEDCEKKSHKAMAAAERMKKIFPGVNTKGVVLSIPMPGHKLDAKEGLDEFTELESLIVSHDVCFILTDSRESRWLPTVISATHNKIVINIALGYSSYVVMRHGCGPKETQPTGERMGCYFCNDIVAAGNSQTDRTLDQQCTVTRPGLSFIAAGLGVEIMINLITSPDGIHSRAPAATHTIGQDVDLHHSMTIPHQIRGSLQTFDQYCLHTPAFDHCTACSKYIVQAYADLKFEFLRRVTENSKLLEEISGVASLMESIDLDGCVESDEEF